MSYLGTPVQSQSSRTSSIGLHVVHAGGEKPIVDVVFVHGLKGDRLETWTWVGKKHEEVFWPRDLLLPDLEEAGVDARIMTYGYNSHPDEFLGAASTNKLHDHAVTFVNELYYNRRRARGVERPIIFVAHSLGGLLVKRALIYANTCSSGHNLHLRSIKTSTFGILFFGTPHQGSDMAKWASMMERFISLLPKGIIDTNPSLINTLGKNSETLQNINESFLGLSRELKMFYFWEELPTTLPNGGRQRVVEQWSAVPDGQTDTERGAIHATHSDMVKFYGFDSPGYSVVSGAITRYAEEAEYEVEERWRTERIQQDVAKRDQLRRILPASLGFQAQHHHRHGGHDSRGHSPARLAIESANHVPSDRLLQYREVPASEAGDYTHYPDEVYESDGEAGYENVEPEAAHFVVPFHPNQWFVGREEELKKLHKMLHNPDRKSKGKASVVVHALPGAGKTHLVRQYVYTYFAKGFFRGGIFWIKAVNSASIRTEFWNIAVALGLKAENDVMLERDDESFVKLVLRWFERHTNWLLIFDGVDVETDAEISSFARFVPFGGRDSSILFTSVNSNIVGTARLGSPDGLELKRLNDVDAVELLFRYSHIKHPNHSEKFTARELVKRLHYLPLSIHSAGSFIREKRITISKYFDLYRHQPLVGGLVSFHMIIDQLRVRHEEATRLLMMLSFVNADQIPVDMIKWGIMGFERLEENFFAKDEDYGEARSLDNTISHLLRYSLVDRVTVTHTENGRRWRVDTLFLHRVVQDVCRDRMKSAATETDEARDDRRDWVLLTALIYNRSYEYMEARRHDREILVSDLNTYQVHGQQVLKYCEQYSGESESTKVLRNSLSAIEEAIKHYSPRYHREGSDAESQSDGSKDWRPPTSIFRSGSSSESMATTPSPTLTRKDTWITDLDKRGESPTDTHPLPTPITPTIGSPVSEPTYFDEHGNRPRRPKLETKTHDTEFRYKPPKAAHSKGTAIPGHVGGRTQSHSPSPSSSVILNSAPNPQGRGRTQSPSQGRGQARSSSTTQPRRSSSRAYTPSPPPGSITIPSINHPNMHMNPRFPSPFHPGFHHPSSFPSSFLGRNSPPNPYSISPYQHPGSEAMERLPSSTLSEPIRRSPPVQSSHPYGLPQTQTPPQYQNHPYGLPQGSPSLAQRQAAAGGIDFTIAGQHHIVPFDGAYGEMYPATVDADWGEFQNHSPPLGSGASMMRAGSSKSAFSSQRGSRRGSVEVNAKQMVNKYLVGGIGLGISGAAGEAHANDMKRGWSEPGSHVGSSTDLVGR
ncbi:hypothetical protein BJ508DRAFT_228758 [Ascobolus immersus RN42]|uniref:Uncharacterized protein n=1 Tax=Ascobolus immersus RN42 TaxID=1160509 RepID=A0A3N4HY55_ASCIM|nr:hypothetical protein BJ508DRAFT_228758 [Ascobolus immersus RN42]